MIDEEGAALLAKPPPATAGIQQLALTVAVCLLAGVVLLYLLKQFAAPLFWATTAFVAALALAALHRRLAVRDRARRREWQSEATTEL